ncbi:MAG: dephospho-CoA kinase [Candidatus Carbobacillus altaicus]|uniref:Dephospho-CoA kinase n=1 Tax=Candidatus Carbonibacillus altaicus TaxID=2163959 RepID=A0A2R6XYC6_9BACL|nr:dephospho-CoA kinase [Candidatus Carbobacillus altaicus]PTQ55434.1 MAG: Dephospho-CoA kinase [Candidatus Carbobacillus altaicus]
MIIGLTGGIATGKSTVSRLLQKRGFPVIDADQVARDVVRPGEEALAEIVRVFGEDMLKEDGTLDRKRLGVRIFEDDEARKTLEAILHPRIRARMLEAIQKIETISPYPVIVDVPLLFETGWDRLTDANIVVFAPPDVQKKRLMARDQLSEKEAYERIQAQWPLEEKVKRADWVLDNSGDENALAREVERLIEHWHAAGFIHDKEKNGTCSGREKG